MSFLDILSTLFIGPLKLVFEIIYVVANDFIGHPGLSIIVLSLIMNLLVLPLYKRADAMQEASRDTEAKLHDGVAHIKKTFSGDEKMMILQTYYRQNHYKPTDALNGSVSLLLEVPFFMAAYQFLSNASVLNGASFGPIADLSAPDGLIVIGSLSINLLPILMTLINVISSAIYLKGFPVKTKIQLYAMALFFLVFLYTSPSGLVFYWTLNNLFSLVKTIFYKLKNPRKIIDTLLCILSALLLAYGWYVLDTQSAKRGVILIVMGILCLLPKLFSALKEKMPTKKTIDESKPSRKNFLLGALFLTVLVGLAIPSTFIAASPQEYVDTTNFHNPLWYIVSSLCLSAGTFLVWMNVFYWLASPQSKITFERMIWVACGVMVVNYMFFGTDLGIISSDLKYDEGMAFTAAEQLLNLLTIVLVAAVLYLCSVKWTRRVGAIILAATLALGSMGVVNMVTINTSINALTEGTAAEEDATFRLSKDGKNVIVLMLDRAAGEYIPYIFNEKPELQEQFAGFTYYDNTISFGAATRFTSASVFGGYEYTPVEMNKRSDELLVDKHNEALKVMPVLFSENDYEVTVCNPPFANYSWIPDLSIYNDYPEIRTITTDSMFNQTTTAMQEQTIENNRRNFFCFSLMKTMPVSVQPLLYDDGIYNRLVGEGETTNVQTVTDISTAEGINWRFANNYEIMQNLSDMTQITTDSVNTLLCMMNEITHAPMLLQEPDYTPSNSVDNAAYDAENADRFTVDGNTVQVTTTDQMTHYHINMAAMIQLGNWFDYLRENDVYDNTRIILVSDHSWPLFSMEELTLGGDNKLMDMELYYPLLMVKDFDSDEFVTSSEFMTNADVPTLAVESLIEDPVNPFTGKSVTDTEKLDHDQFVLLSWDDGDHSGTQFQSGKWASVTEDMRDKDNWTFYDGEMVLSENNID